MYDALSENGLEQAGALGQWFAERGARFDRVLTGTLNRQQQTAAAMIRAMGAAKIISTQADSRWDEFALDAVYTGIGPGLAEQDSVFAAEYAALRSDMADPRAAVHRHWRNCDATVVRAWIEERVPYDGESFPDFRRRVQAAFLELPAGENIVVVTSATPIAICAALTLDVGSRRVMQLAGAQYNTGYTEMDPRPGDPRLVSFNNTPHLPADRRTHR